ncbi:MAG: hypothetical protein ACP5VQ_03470 [Phycisphaerae bacterium]
MHNFLKRVIILVVLVTIIATSINLARYYTLRNARVRQLQRERQHLMRVINRLTGRRRMAELVVDGQVINGKKQVLQSSLLWEEFVNGPDGRSRALAIRKIVIPGDTPYVDGYVLKFQDKFVEDGDILRGKSLAFFRRIFSHSQAPNHGTSLLDPRGVPPCLDGKNGRPDSFTLRLWQHIHQLMEHPQAAKKLGLDIVQGQAVYRPVKPGRLYVIYLQNDGGLQFTQKSGGLSLIDRMLKEANQDHSRTASKPTP